jgi:hypothetical protein
VGTPTPAGRLPPAAHIEDNVGQRRCGRSRRCAAPADGPFLTGPLCAAVMDKEHAQQRDLESIAVVHSMRDQPYANPEY